MIDRDLVLKFARLFSGRDDAYGVGSGRVYRAPVTLLHYQSHLEGRDDGIGIFPLRDDGTVSFGAIDLDRPDFETARALADALPGVQWIERSRSGNAHIWTFFERPAEAWYVRGVMRAVLEAFGEPGVEVFPKQDRLVAVPGQPTPLGNYINLPYHGDERPILDVGREYTVEGFVEVALERRNDPEDWRRRAEYLGVETPAERDARRSTEFGTSPVLHECAEHIIHGALTGERPIVRGHRSVVYFNLSKQLLMWQEMDEERAWELVSEVNAASPDPLPARELRRIFDNAASGRWTSTGCDDPVMAPYVSPTCPIAGRG